MPENLLKYKKNVFSQNGEDGIVGKIFDGLGKGVDPVCCEFGAWDGIHLSNARNLILQGWTAIMIEGEKDRLETLKQNYKDNPKVFAINAFVDTQANSLENLLKKHGLEDYGNRIDFLSIDIDGLDYYIFENLSIRPKVICVEVTSAHDPLNDVLLDRDTAVKCYGQPLGAFSKLAKTLGYSLVCYTGNAMYIRNDIAEKFGFAVVPDVSAYRGFLSQLPTKDRQWLYAVNLGLGEPFYKYHNSFLTKEALGFGFGTAFYLRMKYTVIKFLKTRVFK